MTLVACLKAKDGIVLAADTRATIGDPRGLTAINDNQNKLYEFGECGLALAGSSEMGNVLLDELRKQHYPTNGVQVDELAFQIAELSASLFDRWFGNIPTPNRPAVLITLAGYRNVSGTSESMIYLFSSQMNFSPQLFGNSPCLSGTPQYAVYLVNRYYDPSISLERAKSLAAYLITETASQDPKVGSIVNMAVITEKGYKRLEQQAVDQIKSNNAKLNQQLRDFFMREISE